MGRKIYQFLHRNPYFHLTTHHPPPITWPGLVAAAACADNVHEHVAQPRHLHTHPARCLGAHNSSAPSPPVSSLPSVRQLNDRWRRSRSWPSTEVGRVRLVRWNTRRMIGGGDLARRVPTEHSPLLTEHFRHALAAVAGCSGGQVFLLFSWRGRGGFVDLFCGEGGGGF